MDQTTLASVLAALFGLGSIGLALQAYSLLNRIDELERNLIESGRSLSRYRSVVAYFRDQARHKMDFIISKKLVQSYYEWAPGPLLDAVPHGDARLLEQPNDPDLEKRISDALVVANQAIKDKDEIIDLVEPTLPTVEKVT